MFKWWIIILGTILFLATSCTKDSEDEDDLSEIDLQWAGPCPEETVEFRMVDVGAISLYTGCKGTGSVAILLHGFPEFWYGWNKVIDSLSQDLRLIIPDQRGYNLSDKPDSLSAYEVEYLTQDIANLISEVSNEPVLLVGHDWGGVIAWLVAHHHPDLVKALVILNGPHPDIFKRELENNPDQQDASNYITLFQSSLAETILSGNDYATLSGTMSGSLSPSDLEIYKDAWAQPGALTAMLNWYRASYDNGVMSVGENITISVPTLVLWGLDDTAILEGNLIGLDQYVSDLEIQTFENAGHFVAHDKPLEISNAIREFAIAQGM